MIKIIDGWYYTFDGVQYTLIHEEMRNVTNRTTKETRLDKVREIHGYYTSVSAMIVKLSTLLAKEKIDSGEITTIQEHLNELKKNNDILREIIAPF